MRVCDLTTSISRLQRSTVKLKDRWRLTAEHWTDPTSQQFERSSLQPLEPRITATVAALYKFAETLAKAEKECGEDHEIG